MGMFDDIEPTHIARERQAALDVKAASNVLASYQWVSRYFFAGSRVTCEPPVLHTDLDVIVLCDLEYSREGIESSMFGDSWQGCGLYDCNQDEFTAMRKGDINIILTFDAEDYKRWHIAATLAKHLNLREKEDRIALFQAIRHGAYEGSIKDRRLPEVVCD